ncbi:hypothetical protein [Natrialba sp. INN-245]|uniref:DUF7122 family protein n=1 Tax=Natrialba sp. INN-245 TaxID=2690967 RepID=UPI0013137B01|nr:hypothetical protein [Natrialba sp. INN-245]MWV41092.1 hypothetical protein [Natrialba sp. INN-245]
MVDDTDADGASEDGSGGLESNDGQRFDRLPATEAERTVEGRVSRAAVLEYFEDRFAIPPETFEDYTFWEKGAGKIWIYAGESPTRLEIEAIGMTCLRTRQEHWKPTTDFAQRFGHHASACVIDLEREAARRFTAGEDQELAWDGDWGYLIAAHEIGGSREPLGIGLYVHGELRSMVPKGRQRDISRD